MDGNRTYTDFKKGDSLTKMAILTGQSTKNKTFLSTSRSNSPFMRKIRSHSMLQKNCLNTTRRMKNEQMTLEVQVEMLRNKLQEERKRKYKVSQNITRTMKQIEKIRENSDRCQVEMYKCGKLMEEVATECNTIK